jgi:hypothetical protein
MLNLLRAGYVAAIRQFAAVCLIGLLVVTFTKIRIFEAVQAIHTAQTGDPVSMFFAYADVLTAIAVMLTCDRSSLQTADSIRRASRIMYPTDPNRAADILQTLLWIPTAGFAVLALKPLPNALIDACNSVGFSRAMEVSWPGAMSICMAAFGANARAASRASRRLD